jgi:hypothetical protein
MEVHARRCENLSPDRFGSNLRQEVLDDLAQLKANKENTPALNQHTPQPLTGVYSYNSPPLQNSNIPRPLKRKMTAETALEDIHDMWTQTQQAEFGADFCKMLVASNVSWNMANNPETYLFFDKYLPQARIPDRRALGGQILDGVVRKVDEETKERIGGKIGTGQCDGWKNIAKTPVITSMMTIENEVSLISCSVSLKIKHGTDDTQAYLIQSHDMTGEPKTGDRLLEVVKDDINTMKEKYDIEPIAWCTDDGPDGKKMRRLLPSIYPWIIVLVCWAHQIHLIVGDFLSMDSTFLNVVVLALDIVRWINHHGEPLAWLRAEQEMTYEGASYSLFLPVATRWLAHYLTFARLLKIKDAVKTWWCRKQDKIVACAGRTAVQQENARNLLRPIGDDTFWDNLLRSMRCVSELYNLLTYIQHS